MFEAELEIWELVRDLVKLQYVVMGDAVVMNAAVEGDEQAQVLCGGVSFNRGLPQNVKPLARLGAS